MNAVRILAPAKINLGLAIIGKRDDGYHEIDTIMVMLDLCDEIVISPNEAGIKIEGMDDVPLESNLMTRAARLWSAATRFAPNWNISIRKRIPSPAGLGGGSSDAAAVLIALNRLHDDPLSPSDLASIAAEVGSDCPFFLGSPCARATGTGTDIRELPAPSKRVVLAVPRVEAIAKTASLYGSLTTDDYGTHEEIEAIENSLRWGKSLPGSLPNGFDLAAAEMFSSLTSLRNRLSEIAGNASLSGAGPAVYAIVDSEEESGRLLEKMQAICESDVDVFTARTLDSRPQPEFLQ